ncbi:MAG: hypothetical protein AB7O88_03290, partial [Reyranellaceae bacterium]
SYGYNLHKRAALSLNCISAILKDPDDEILFVDYNTPDDYPTFPEAIQDTLTLEARRRVRVLRVRPKHHAPLAGKTHLVALEAVSRNVGVRRSNPNNRWILSTNTDLIFVPKARESLSEIAKSLPDAYFHIPRFELPESMWELLNRMDPAGAIERMREWGMAFHLNETILSEHPEYRFDGPGDFQLILREDIFQISGFHEEMLLGWHVDANIAKRLSLLRGYTGDLSAEIAGYHCDHTRQVTPAHRPGSIQNSWSRFFSDVTIASLPEQSENWGMPGELIEEVSLQNCDSHLLSLRTALKEVSEKPTTTVVDRSTFDKVGYDAAHVLPFLVDALISYDRGIVLGWFAARQDLLTMLSASLQNLGFLSPILVPTELASALALPSNVQVAPQHEVLAKAEIVGFDFGFPVGQVELVANHAKNALALNAQGLLAFAGDEYRRKSRGLAPRRAIVVNAVHSRFALVTSLIGAPVAPISTRIRQGFLAWNGEVDLQPHLHCGPAGEQTDDGIVTRPGVSHVLFGAVHPLPEGRYEFRVELTPRTPKYLPTSMEQEILLDGKHLQRRRHWFFGPSSTLMLRTPFVVPSNVLSIDKVPLGVEFRLTTLGRADCRLTRASATLMDSDLGGP